MGSQEVSKPLMIGVIAIAVIVVGLFGWYFFMRPQRYPGYQAPMGGGAAVGGPSGMDPRGIPGAGPGSVPGGGRMPGGGPAPMPVSPR